MADTAALVGCLCARTLRAGCISSFSWRTKPGQVDTFLVRIMVAAHLTDRWDHDLYHLAARHRSS
jgi:hypothetical protein